MTVAFLFNDFNVFSSTFYVIWMKYCNCFGLYGILVLIVSHDRDRLVEVEEWRKMETKEQLSRKGQSN